MLIRDKNMSYYGRKTNNERMIKMLPLVVVKVAEIAAGVLVGVKASDALDKGIEVVKKVVEAKKGASK